MTIDELKTMLEKTIPADGVPVTHPKVPARKKAQVRKKMQKEGVAYETVRSLGFLVKLSEEQSIVLRFWTEDERTYAEALETSELSASDKALLDGTPEPSAADEGTKPKAKRVRKSRSKSADGKPRKSRTKKPKITAFVMEDAQYGAELLEAMRPELDRRRALFCGIEDAAINKAPETVMHGTTWIMITLAGLKRRGLSPTDAAAECLTILSRNSGLSYEFWKLHMVSSQVALAIGTIETGQILTIKANGQKIRQNVEDIN